MRQYGNLIFLSILIFSCNPFSPDEPGSWGEGEFNPPVASNYVVENFLSSINYRNISNYRSCFNPENFIFSPDPSDTLGQFKEILTRWDFDAEVQSMDRIFSFVGDTSGILSLRLETISKDSMEDYVIYYEDYELYISGSENYYARGKLSFKIIKVEGFWYISEWKDFRGDTTDWGEIKAIFYTR